jgi:hypothetical protein
MVNIDLARGRLFPCLREAIAFRIDLLKLGNEGGREYVERLIQGLTDAYLRIFGIRDPEMYVRLTVNDSGRPIVALCNKCLPGVIDFVYLEAWVDWVKDNHAVSYRDWQSLGVVRKVGRA